MLQGERFLEEGEGETDLRGGRLEFLTFTVRSPLPLEAILFLFRPLPVACCAHGLRTVSPTRTAPLSGAGADDHPPCHQDHPGPLRDSSLDCTEWAKGGPCCEKPHRRPQRTTRTGCKA